MGVSLGTATFVRPNGMTLAVDIEVQDTGGEMTTWDSGAGGATGTDYYEHPEELRLVHLTLDNVVTATSLRLIVNGTPTAQVIRPNENFVNTLAMPVTGAQPLNIGFAAGAKIQFIGVT